MENMMLSHNFHSTHTMCICVLFVKPTASICLSMLCLSRSCVFFCHAASFKNDLVDWTLVFRINRIIKSEDFLQFIFFFREKLSILREKHHFMILKLFVSNKIQKKEKLFGRQLNIYCVFSPLFLLHRSELLALIWRLLKSVLTVSLPHSSVG